METVTGIILFTNLLDGKSILKCLCGYLWRATYPSEELCPNCGRPTKHSTPTTVEEYKASRKIKEE